MHLSPSLYSYYQICPRKMWLYANGISMEHTSDTVTEGKQIGEQSYQYRSEKYTELALSVEVDDVITINAQIDFYDAKNRVVHEVKKSNKMEEAHIAQVQMYLYVLECSGVDSPTGLLEYPKLRKTKVIKALTTLDRESIRQKLKEITKILDDDICPSRLSKKSFCRSCSYFDLCWVDEV